MAKELIPLRTRNGQAMFERGKAKKDARGRFLPAADFVDPEILEQRRRPKSIFDDLIGPWTPPEWVEAFRAIDERRAMGGRNGAASKWRRKRERQEVEKAIRGELMREASIFRRRGKGSTDAVLRALAGGEWMTEGQIRAAAGRAHNSVTAICRLLWKQRRVEKMKNPAWTGQAGDAEFVWRGIRGS